MLPAMFLYLLTLLSMQANAAGWPDVSQPLRNAMYPGSQDAALIVSIEDYFMVEDVRGARKNGRDWYSYLVKSQKIPIQNVRFLEDRDATKENILAEAKRTAELVKAGGRLWFVFIGHGAPARNQRDGILLGVDVQQTAKSIYSRGVPQKQLLSILEDGDAAVFAVIDSCFSGKSNSGNAIAENLQPLIVTRSIKVGGTTVLSAGKSNEFAGPLPGLQRPAFSYLALGALRGWGDSNEDQVVTPNEVVAYAQKVMSVMVYDRSQTPEARGIDLNEPITRAKENGPDLTRLRLSRHRMKKANRKSRRAYRKQRNDEYTRKQLADKVNRLQLQASAEWRRLQSAPQTKENVQKVNRFVSRYDSYIVTSGHLRQALQVPQLIDAEKWLQRYSLNKKRQALQKKLLKDFDKAIKTGKCDKAGGVLDMLSIRKLITERKIDLAICQAKKQPKNVHFWRKAWLLHKQHKGNKQQRKEIAKHTGSLQLTVTDNQRNRLDNAEVYLSIAGLDESEAILQKTKRGIVKFDGIPKGAFSLLVRKGKHYEETDFSFQLTARRLVRKIRINKILFTQLQVPQIPSNVGLQLQKEDGWMSLKSGEQYEIVSGIYPVQATIGGAEFTENLVLKEGKQPLSIPWAYQIQDQNGRELYTHVSFAKGKVQLNKNIALHKDGKYRFLLTGTIKAAAPGQLKIIQVDTSKSSVVGASKSLQQNNRRIMGSTVGVGFSVVGSVVSSAVGGYFQFLSAASAEGARNINTAGDFAEYSSLSQQYNQQQTYARIGYAGLGVTLATGTYFHFRAKAGKRRGKALEDKYRQLLQAKRGIAEKVSVSASENLQLTFVSIDEMKAEKQAAENQHKNRKKR